MKKFLCAALALVMLTLALASCDNDRKVLGILPSYTGLPVTTTTHEFTKDDFFVLANYDNGDTVIDDYEFVVESLSDGYYVLKFTYKDVSNLLYVKCDVPIYPSDMEE